ncbi:TetR/AcrR family transcriptional regulator [Frankia sp. R43]|uniref:TetR/AcrR family transcriptional regulator n=1 Tax=Frankia sp. R43 TaxID=269536 RepID=UPI0006CA5935|nr:TetR/AcrR family transcriptional regulator [Frankia sp. R43]
MSRDGARRGEILDAAARLFATAGIRATLKDIADAAGILAGSLYHHFDSKDAIVAELIRRYHAALDGVAQAAVEELRRPDGRPPAELVVAFGEAIAGCAVQHRAAVLLSYYEPPVGASDELVQVSARTPSVVRAVLLELLEAGRDSGWLRPGIDLALLADRMCESMIHVGIGVSHRLPGADRLPALRCRILLEGVAAGPVDGAALDRSAAFAAAQEQIASWPEADELAEAGRPALIRAAARAEFGRRGYEATTIRDIAAAAGVSVAGVYRVADSKDQLLASIMISYVEALNTGWRAVLAAPAGAVERLDALLWLNAKIMERYGEEFRIQFGALRQSPPSSPDLTWSFPSQLRQVKKLLADGGRDGDLRLTGSSADVRARSLFELLFTPDDIVSAVGPRGALELARDTVLRGVARPAVLERPALEPAQSATGVLPTTS